MVDLFTVEGDLISRCEIFDETDVDAALARFEELQPQAPRLENAAGRMVERYQACFSAHDWTAMADLLADDMVADDRRHVVNAGVRRGRDVHIADNRAAVEVGAETISSRVIATRGEHLALAHVHSFNHGMPLGAEMLTIAEIDADERIVAAVSFDLDDVDAAYEELDARYLAGEAAAYAHTWSVIADECAAFNRHELTAADYITVDHRPLPIVEAYSQAALRVWDVTPDFGIHVEAVHRLNGFGTVATYQANGTSPEGFGGEWRMILLLTVEGDRINHCEVYDESDLDAALARFEELQPQEPRLENRASQIIEQYQACFATRDWAAMAELLADDIVADDRRRVVNAGARRGREVQIADLRAAVDVGAETISSTVIATRGERLALAHVRSVNRFAPGEVGAEMLGIAEIDADERIVATVSFELDDIDAAYEELDSRYLAGEVGGHAHTWSVIARECAAFNRHELPATDWVTIDHRQLAPIDASDLQAAMRAVWDLTPDLTTHIEAVHRLSSFGAVVTYTAHGTSREGFDAEWRMIEILTVERARLNRCEIFDEADLDAALARFEELQPQAPRLENAAIQVAERLRANFAARDWTARAELLAEDCSTEDRRRVVNAGNQHGRDADIANMRAIAAVGVANIALTTIATRGERLALSRARMSGRDQRPEAFYTETLTILEVDTNNRAAAQVVFDPDDIDAALAELDARYLAGEAAAHAHTWSLVTRAYAAFNRREFPSTTPDSVFIDHRPLQTLGAVDLVTAARSIFDIAPDLSSHIEAVHRLGELGAVVTHTLKGTSQEGFDADWRTVEFYAFEGDLLSRCEAFDETDLDTALARFEELQPQAPHTENAASQVGGRFMAHFAACDWDGMAEILADNFSRDDRRRLVGAGVRDGRDAWLADMRATADLWIANVTSTVTATRGGRLVLMRGRFSHRDQGRESFLTELLGIIEIDTDERIVALVTFDPDDIDAALAELDARYLAGEAAAHAHTWSVIAEASAGFNRHELPASTPDLVYIDHRPLVSIEAVDLAASLRAVWDITSDVSVYIEAVHRLSELGTVVTQVLKGTSHEGFDAEWRMVDIFTVDGDLISRAEIFDETDLDVALARFEELQAQAPRLENAASQLIRRFQAYFAARNWAAIAEISADEIFTDDRRSVVSSGILRGRDVDIANVRATADLGATDLTSTVIATRGERLALARLRLSGRDQRPEAFHSEMHGIVEIDADNRFAARILFDLDDFDAAIAELDARYLASEAAAHAHTWSVLVRTYAAFNRHELYPTTPDWVNADHRRGIAFAPGDMTAYLRAGKDLTPDTPAYIETVHRLSDFGAVVTQAMKGTSSDGFDAEWQEIGLFTFDGDLISRCEIFDEADLDAALARFEELDRQVPLLENATTRTWGRVTDAFNRRDVDGFLALTSADRRSEDRRKGLRHLVEGPAIRNAVQAMFETPPSGFRMTAEPIAIRGPRLSLTRVCHRDTDDPDQPIAVELLEITEVGDDGLMQDTVIFDPDDLNGAIAELTARWIACGEVAHPEIIKSAHRLTEAINRHDWDAFAALSAGATYVNHRQLSSPGVQTIGDHMSLIRAMASRVPDFWVEPAEVLTQSAMGLVNHVVLRGTSTDGVAIEIPLVALMLLDGDRVTRFETFDVDQRDLALARFEELSIKSQPE
jgi:hypothetical protein